ncbi:hypothetical protein JCM10207_004750 [Rhodosporidiobolus poonsookiae]
MAVHHPPLHELLEGRPDVRDLLFSFHEVREEGHLNRTKHKKGRAPVHSEVKVRAFEGLEASMVDKGNWLELTEGERHLFTTVTTAEWLSSSQPSLRSILSLLGGQPCVERLSRTVMNLSPLVGVRQVLLEGPQANPHPNSALLDAPPTWLERYYQVFTFENLSALVPAFERDHQLPRHDRHELEHVFFILKHMQNNQLHLFEPDEILRLAISPTYRTELAAMLEQHAHRVHSLGQLSHRQAKYYHKSNAFD